MDWISDLTLDESVFAEDPEPEAAKPKTRKRVRKDRQGSDAPIEPPIKRSRGKQGKLKGIMNMPIEVFTEVGRGLLKRPLTIDYMSLSKQIAKYLYPLDLILLSRANRFFRQLLLNRSATQTWQHALSNVDGLPPCPEELCEPQYAALMFTKYCSMCGKQAPRPMDPKLLVRLCVTCRDQHDAAALNSELNAIQVAGNRMVISSWIARKKREIEQRTKNAQPLIEFLKQQETEQSDSLVARRGQREETIRSRLIGLGWVKGDFEMRETNGAKQWKSLVCVAKPLTERNWETILPQLTTLLERSRELRLEAEASQRGHQRYLKTNQWISSALEESGPYARVLGCSGKTTTISVPGSDSPQIQEAAGPSIAPSKASVTLTQYPTYALLTWSAGGLKPDNKVLNAPLPSCSLALAWNPFKQLLDTDVPMDDFEVALVGMRPTFDRLLVEWRANLEEALVGRLPSSDPSIMKDSLVLTPSTTTSSEVIPEFAIEVDSQPIEDLPLDTRRLLRADTVWSYTYSTTPYFYPDDFRTIYNDTASSIIYHTKASEVAKVLLTALGCPNAILESSGAPACDMVQHYADELKKWEDVQKHMHFKDGRITYIFTHNTGAAQDDKPLDPEKNVHYR
ncbi:hypothetical protein FRC10_005278 [Ceratobasidium sp. 414]|nr:hypothetical protein FRC10_005278 [Ceratobasidium sp. 414]